MGQLVGRRLADSEIQVQTLPGKVSMNKKFELAGLYFLALSPGPTSPLPREKNEINITENRHFTLAYLLGKLGYRLYGQRDKNRL